MNTGKIREKGLTTQNDSYNYPLYWINLLKNPIVEVVKKSLTRIKCKEEPFGPSPSFKNWFFYFKSHFRVTIFLIRLKSSLNVKIPILNK